MRAQGIDISKWQGTYQIAANPPRPVNFVIQRLSYGVFKDEALAVLTSPVLASPIKGAYHYVSSNYGWKAQADIFIGLMNDKYDFWAWDAEKKDNINTTAYISGVIPALEYISITTKKPGLIYTNPDMWGTWFAPIQNDLINTLNRTDLNIDLWVSHYWLPESARTPEGTANYFYVNGASNMPKDWKFWQYDNNGDGGRGKEFGVGSLGLDLDTFNGTVEELTAWAKGQVPVPIPPIPTPIPVPLPAGGEMNILPVVYVSQLMNGALEHNNDCGSASSLMLLRTFNLANDVSVDQFYNSIIPSGDMALSVGQIQSRMASYGLATDWKVDQVPELVFSYLRSRKPILALIHYGTLVDAGFTEKTGFRGGHFLVITGIDLDNIFIDDPYRDDAKTNIPVPIATFMKAWTDANIDGNPVRVV